MKVIARAALSLLIACASANAATFRTSDEIYAPGTWTARELIGKRVDGSSEPNIASVHDVLIADGKAQRLVLGIPVGGIAERYVVIDAKEATRVYESDMLSALKIASSQPLSALPDFSYDSANGSATEMPKGWLSAAGLAGKTVIDSQNNNVGPLEDIVFAKNDRVLAGLLSVGGFLSVGEKSVAVNFADLKFMPDGQLRLDAPRAALEGAPNVGLKFRRGGA